MALAPGNASSGPASFSDVISAAIASKSQYHVPGSCSVVVAEHESSPDVHAIRQIVPEHCHLHIYSKTSEGCAAFNNLEGSSCEQLANWGREQHSFLRHVAHHYDELTDHVFFVPTPLEKHARLDLLQKSLREAGSESFHCLTSVPDDALDWRMRPLPPPSGIEHLSLTPQCSLLWINSWIMINAGSVMAKGLKHTH